MSVTRVYTLDSIRQMRRDKREEIRKSAAKMQTLGSQLFAPQRSTSRMEGIMQSVNAGMAAWDGVMTGIRVMRRVQNFFRKKKK